MIPKPTDRDLGRSDLLDYRMATVPGLEAFITATLACWIRRAVAAESRVKELEARFARAAAKIDGVDYRDEHFRANATPDELRDIILGLSEKVAELEAVNAKLVKAGQAMLRIHGVEEYRNGTPIPCPCDGCKMTREVLAEATT